jgi:hypothetical protein
MTSQEYIDSGLLLDYNLGLLNIEERNEIQEALEKYPDLADELNSIAKSLEKLADVHAIPPPSELRKRVLDTLDNLLVESQMNLLNLPIINRFTDHRLWLNSMKPLLPSHVDNGRFVKVLTQTDTLSQVLIMSSTDIEDEVHTDEYESFVILEGECECHIGDGTVVRLRAGGFLEIPLHEHHDVKIISNYVVGVMQRIAV